MTELIASSLLRPDISRRPYLYSEFQPDERLLELQRVEQDLTTERAWLVGHEKLLLADKTTIVSAVQTGALEQVKYDQPHFSPTYDFYQRQSHDQLQDLKDNTDDSTFSIPYLRPLALNLLKLVCAEAHDLTITDHDLPIGIVEFKFAVPSMTRSVNYQRTIRSRGVLVTDPESGNMSTHTYGLAFDIDHSGIYTLTNSGWHAVGIGRQEQLFLPNAIKNLALVLEKYQDTKELHAVCEVPSGRGAYHVAVNPAKL